MRGAPLPRATRRGRARGSRAGLCPRRLIRSALFPAASSTSCGGDFIQLFLIFGDMFRFASGPIQLRGNFPPKAKGGAPRRFLRRAAPLPLSHHGVAPPPPWWSGSCSSARYCCLCRHGMSSAARAAAAAASAGAAAVSGGRRRQMSRIGLCGACCMENTNRSLPLRCR